MLISVRGLGMPGTVFLGHGKEWHEFVKLRTPHNSFGVRKLGVNLLPKHCANPPGFPCIQRPQP